MYSINYKPKYQIRILQNLRYKQMESSVMAQLPRGVQTRTVNVGRMVLKQNLNGNNMTKFFLSLHILLFPFVFGQEKRYQVKLQNL
jgi:hypothetical protein